MTTNRAIMHKYSGRTGNKISSFALAASMVESLGGGHIELYEGRLSSAFRTSNQVFIPAVNGIDSIFQKNKSVTFVFYPSRGRKHCENLIEKHGMETYEDLLRRWPRILKNFYKKYSNIKPIKTNDIVIHSRVDDMWDHPGFIQAPLEYFPKALSEFPRNKNIILITQPDDDADVRNFLEIYCRENKRNLTVYDQDKEKAIGYFLGAKYFIIGGHSSFPRMFLLGNKDLEKIVIPNLKPNITDEICFPNHGCKTVFYDVLDYVKDGEWGKDQRNKLLNHPNNLIVRR